MNNKQRRIEKKERYFKKQRLITAIRDLQQVLSMDSIFKFAGFSKTEGNRTVRSFIRKGIFKQVKEDNQTVLLFVKGLNNYLGLRGYNEQIDIVKNDVGHTLIYTKEFDGCLAKFKTRIYDDLYDMNQSKIIPELLKLNLDNMEKQIDKKFNKLKEDKDFYDDINKVDNIVVLSDKYFYKMSWLLNGLYGRKEETVRQINNLMDVINRLKLETDNYEYRIYDYLDNKTTMDFDLCGENSVLTYDIKK